LPQNPASRQSGLYMLPILSPNSEANLISLWTEFNLATESCDVLVLIFVHLRPESKLHHCCSGTLFSKAKIKTRLLN